jgi:DNA-binding response OmpR family regulator
MDRNRILLVDDDVDLLEAVRLRLRSAGFEVLTAGDGIAATQLIKREKPDLVVLDVNMPGGNGHTVARRMRGDPELTSIPVILLTACMGDTDYEQAWSNGVEKYIVKPFHPEELLLAIDDLLPAGTTAF